ncbi:TPA: LysR family transcriptional regulator [Pseudomonas aeruginosa]|nr:LysR family transcriptional regulator [Pseudomonas aeruginosa]HBP4890820.1 LysR family transcriptional regulator [Pseudomonas aeruginosa]
MNDATSQLSHFRLAIAPGVPSSRLSTLLAVQRAEEPDITIAFFETSCDDLVAGLHDGRYDAGMSLRNESGSSLKSQPLWIENMAVAVPLRSPLLGQETLTLAELLDYPLFRWPAETCSLLDRRLSSLLPLSQRNIQHVTSFEMMAVWVAADYGVGICAQSRIVHACSWGLGMRTLSDGPYQISTYLMRPAGQSNRASERFERRAHQVGGADAS